METSLYALSQDYIEMFDDCLDDCEGDAVTILGCTYSKSAILKQVDPICYRMAFDEYVQSLYEEECEENRDEEDKVLISQELVNDICAFTDRYIKNN